jgi:hypothetical protein
VGEAQEHEQLERVEPSEHETGNDGLAEKSSKRVLREREYDCWQFYGNAASQ